MKPKSIFRTALLFFVFTAGRLNANAQTGEQQLTSTILHLDSAFWNAYNNCDTGAFKNFVTTDVEFYHDKGGITMGAPALIESLDKNICGNVNSRVRREAVAGTVKVYPMRNGNEIYGAIILGDHSFYLTEKDKPEYQSGAASFSDLWILKNGSWKMSRILSYNHHAPEYINRRKEIIVPDNQLKQLAGTYKSAQSGKMSVEKGDKVLLLKGGNNTYILYGLSPISYFTKDRDLLFEFVKDAHGKPVKMIVKERGVVADELQYEK